MRKLKPRTQEIFYCLVLGLVVFAVRVSMAGPAYYVDGPRHVQAILSHTYVIQPPGYWLYTRLGGLLSTWFTPERSLSLLSNLFSACGCVAFWFCAKRLVSRTYAAAGTLLYAVVFFAQFSGEIQSTYASQLLFPPLTFYFMLRYREDNRLCWLIAIAYSFSLGAGFRPSDGVFLLPLLVLFGWKIGRQHQAILAALVLAFCLAWYVPNQLATHSFVHQTNRDQLTSVARGAILLGKFNKYTLSSWLRILLAIGFALGPCSLFLRYARGGYVRWLLCWIAPALAFFMLFFFSDALYLNCILAACILLCLTGMERSERRRLALASLVCAIVMNAGLFLLFTPLQGNSMGDVAFDKYYGNFSWYALRHQYLIDHLER